MWQIKTIILELFLITEPLGQITIGVGISNVALATLQSSDSFYSNVIEGN